MGIQNPVGQKISQWGYEGKIVGVVGDFHGRSLHENIDPVVFICKPEWTGRAFVRFDAATSADAIASIEKLYKKYSPEYPFEYTFLDDDFEKLYNSERVTGSLAYGFTGMAIVISGLGLLGLAAYTAERRKKEISIRKTLGASVTGIVSLMSADFLQLTLIATAAGIPLAWWLMARFLEGYAYHAPLRWQIFVLTAAFVIVASLIIVILQVTRAALVNPVESLRNE
jgi:ABC-type antimicrobial peptide transport system permease subunit